MPSDAPTRSTDRTEAIRVPDQLQQASRSDAVRQGDVADRPRPARDASARREGILGQLETERAHD